MPAAATGTRDAAGGSRPRARARVELAARAPATRSRSPASPWPAAGRRPAVAAAPSSTISALAPPSARPRRGSSQRCAPLWRITLVVPSRTAQASTASTAGGSATSGRRAAASIPAASSAIRAPASSPDERRAAVAADRVADLARAPRARRPHVGDVRRRLVRVGRGSSRPASSRLERDQRQAVAEQVVQVAREAQALLGDGQPASSSRASRSSTLARMSRREPIIMTPMPSVVAAIERSCRRRLRHAMRQAARARRCATIATAPRARRQPQAGRSRRRDEQRAPRSTGRTASARVAISASERDGGRAISRVADGQRMSVRR